MKDPNPNAAEAGSDQPREELEKKSREQLAEEKRQGDSEEPGSGSGQPIGNPPRPAAKKKARGKGVGNQEAFRVLFEGKDASAHALEIPAVGCIVQVATDHANSIVFVPGVKVAEDVEGGAQLVAING